MIEKDSLTEHEIGLLEGWYPYIFYGEDRGQFIPVSPLVTAMRNFNIVKQPAWSEDEFYEKYGSYIEENRQKLIERNYK